jgi:hypothetical protein
VGSPTLIADPSGDANIEIHVQIGRELRVVARKAMGDTADERGAVLAQNGYKIIMSIALVQEDRLTDLCGQLELAMERLLLHGARREIAKIIEPAFADRDHLRQRRELPQLHQQFFSQLFGVVRMNAGRGKQHARMSPRHFDSLAGAVPARASHHHLHHASGHRASNDSLAVRIEAVVSEIDTDIYQGSSYHA